MAHPPAYRPSTHFAAQPSGKVDPAKADIEFQQLAAIVNAIRDNARLIQRDDGRLADASVTLNTLDVSVAAAIVGGWKPKGQWAEDRAYQASDYVVVDDLTYVATQAHTSSTDFATDRAAGKWMSGFVLSVLQAKPERKDFSADGVATIFSLDNVIEENDVVLAFVEDKLVSNYTLSVGAFQVVFDAPPPAAVPLSSVNVVTLHFRVVGNNAVNAIYNARDASAASAATAATQASAAAASASASGQSSVSAAGERMRIGERIPTFYKNWTTGASGSPEAAADATQANFKTDASGYYAEVSGPNGQLTPKTGFALVPGRNFSVFADLETLSDGTGPTPEYRVDVDVFDAAWVKIGTLAGAVTARTQLAGRVKVQIDFSTPGATSPSATVFNFPGQAWARPRIYVNPNPATNGVFALRAMFGADTTDLSISTANAAAASASAGAAGAAATAAGVSAAAASAAQGASSANATLAADWASKPVGQDVTTAGTRSALAKASEANDYSIEAQLAADQINARYVGAAPHIYANASAAVADGGIVGQKFFNSSDANKEYYISLLSPPTAATTGNASSAQIAAAQDLVEGRIPSAALATANEFASASPPASKAGAAAIIRDALTLRQANIQDFASTIDLTGVAGSGAAFKAAYDQVKALRRQLVIPAQAKIHIDQTIILDGDDFGFVGQGGASRGAELYSSVNGPMFQQSTGAPVGLRLEGLRLVGEDNAAKTLACALKVIGAVNSPVIRRCAITQFENMVEVDGASFYGVFEENQYGDLRNAIIKGVGDPSIGFDCRIIGGDHVPPSGKRFIDAEKIGSVLWNGTRISPANLTEYTAEFDTFATSFGEIRLTGVVLEGSKGAGLVGKGEILLKGAGSPGATTDARDTYICSSYIVSGGTNANAITYDNFRRGMVVASKVGAPGGSVRLKGQVTDLSFVAVEGFGNSKFLIADAGATVERLVLINVRHTNNPSLQFIDMSAATYAEADLWACDVGTNATPIAMPAGLEHKVRIDGYARLATTPTVYVRTTGNDTTGKGTSAAPYATVARAYKEVLRFDTSAGIDPVIDIGAGAWPDVTLNGPLLGGGAVRLRGATADATTIGVVTARFGARAIVEQLKFTGAVGIEPKPGSQIEIGNGCHFAATTYDIAATNGGFVSGSPAALTISANKTAHIYAVDGGRVSLAPTAVTTTGTPVYNHCLYATRGGRIFWVAGSLTGSATGKQFHSSDGAEVFTFGTAGIPASIAGEVLAGGSHNGATFSLGDTTVTGALGVTGRVSALGGYSVPVVIAHDSVTRAHGGNTTETIVKTITVPAGAMGPNGFLEFEGSLGATANNANSKLIRIYASDGTTTSKIAEMDMANAITGQFRRTLRNRNATNNQITEHLQSFGFDKSVNGEGGFALDTTQALTITFRVSLANAGDTAYTSGIIVKAAYGA